MGYTEGVLLKNLVRDFYEYVLWVVVDNKVCMPVRNIGNLFIIHYFKEEEKTCMWARLVWFLVYEVIQHIKASETDWML